MKEVSIVALPGDGIGPEVTDVALRVLDTVCEQHNIKLNVTKRPFGGTSYDELGEPVTDETLEICKKHKVVLLGAVGGPKWDDLSASMRPEAALLKLRKELGVFANLRRSAGRRRSASCTQTSPPNRKLSYWRGRRSTKLFCARRPRSF